MLRRLRRRARRRSAAASACRAVRRQSAQPAAPAPAQPAQPQARPQAPGFRSSPSRRSAPRRSGRDVPIFSPKPGQVVSAPRQPLPPEAANRPPAGSANAFRPGSAAAGARRRARRDRRSAARNFPADLVRKASSHRRPLRPGGSATAAPVRAHRSPVSRLHGLSFRPNPELLARIQQSRPGPPPAPGQPRPGPTRPSQPAPGQPIFRGPLRPGQGGPGRPGGPTPGAPSPGSPQMRGGRPHAASYVAAGPY